MKGPNPAPVPPPPLYSHYSVDRRTRSHPDIPDRRAIPPPDHLDRRPIPPPDQLDRRVIPPPDHLDRRVIPPPDHPDRRGIPPPDHLDRRALPPPDRRGIPPPDHLDRRAIVAPDHLDRRAIVAPDLLDRRPIVQPEVIDRRMIAAPDGLERRTIALSDGSIRTYFALPPDPPPFARAYHVLDRLPQSINPSSQPEGNLSSTSNQGGSGKAVVSEQREQERVRQSTPNNSKSDRDSERSGAGPSASKRKHEQEEAWSPSASKRKYEQEEARSLKREKTGSRDKEKEEKGEKGKAHVEVDKKALLDAFLKMSKTINESSSQKRIYFSEGRKGPLRCIVCGSYERESKDFVDMNALLMHAYRAMNPELLIKHRALHKALCVLMGWDPSIEPPPSNSKGYHKLSPEKAQANRDDLILWPPMVVIQNTNWSSKKDGKVDGMGNKEMDAKLLDLGFRGGKSKSLYGREGHQGVTLVGFSETSAGLREAERLSQLFERTGQGRNNWIEVQKAKDNNRSSDKLVKTSDKNQNLVIEYEPGEKRVLYGYLATASDLEIFDPDAKRRVVVRSRKESDFPDK